MAVPLLTALSRAGAAAADAVFAFPVQSKERQDRKQRKDSSHWAQETAEKALLKEHADQDQHQKNNAWNIRGKSEIPACSMEKTSHGLVPLAF